MCQSLFFNKVANLRPATLLKKRPGHRCFPVNFTKFLRKAFLQNTSGRLLPSLSLLFTESPAEVDLGLLQHPRWIKELHLGCCSRPSSASGQCLWKKTRNLNNFALYNNNNKTNDKLHVNNQFLLTQVKGNLYSFFCELAYI